MAERDVLVGVVALLGEVLKGVFGDVGAVAAGDLGGGVGGAGVEHVDVVHALEGGEAGGEVVLLV